MGWAGGPRVCFLPCPTRLNYLTVRFQGRADCQQPPDPTEAQVGGRYRRPVCRRARGQGCGRGCRVQGARGTVPWPPRDRGGGGGRGRGCCLPRGGGGGGGCAAVRCCRSARPCSLHAAESAGSQHDFANGDSTPGYSRPSIVCICPGTPSWLGQDPHLLVPTLFPA